MARDEKNTRFIHSERPHFQPHHEEDLFSQQDEEEARVDVEEPHLSIPCEGGQESQGIVTSNTNEMFAAATSVWDQAHNKQEQQEQQEQEHQRQGDRRGILLSHIINSSNLKQQQQQQQQQQQPQKMGVPSPSALTFSSPSFSAAVSEKFPLSVSSASSPLGFSEPFSSQAASPYSATSAPSLLFTAVTAHALRSQDKEQHEESKTATSDDEEEPHKSHSRTEQQQQKQNPAQGILLRHAQAMLAAKLQREREQEETQMLADAAAAATASDDEALHRQRVQLELLQQQQQDSQNRIDLVSPEQKESSAAIFSSRALRHLIDGLDKTVILTHIRSMKVHSSSVSLRSDAHVLREALVFALAESAKLYSQAELEDALMRIVGPNQDDASLALVSYLMNPQDESAIDVRARATSGTYLRSKFYQARRSLQEPALASTLLAHQKVNEDNTVQELDLDLSLYDSKQHLQQEDNTSSASTEKKSTSIPMLEHSDHDLHHESLEGLPENLSSIRSADSSRCGSSVGSVRSAPSTSRRTWWGRLRASLGFASSSALDCGENESCASSTTSSSSEDSRKSRTLSMGSTSSGSHRSGKQKSEHRHRQGQTVNQQQSRHHNHASSSGVAVTSAVAAPQRHQHDRPHHRRPHPHNHHHHHHHRHHHHHHHAKAGGRGSRNGSNRRPVRTIALTAAEAQARAKAESSMWKKLGLWRHYFGKKHDEEDEEPALKSILKGPESLMHAGHSSVQLKRKLANKKGKDTECESIKHVHFGICSVIGETGELIGQVDVGHDIPAINAQLESQGISFFGSSEGNNLEKEKDTISADNTIVQHMQTTAPNAVCARSNSGNFTAPSTASVRVI